VLQIPKTFILIAIFCLVFEFDVFSQITVVNTDSLKIGENYVPTKFTLGGAIRLNYAWQTYNQVRKDIGGDFGFELFRVDADGECGNIYFSVQYRWYEHFEAIHHGYFGYHIIPGFDIEVGIHQVPFGILPYASHSFWFGSTYYLGFEDDYDTGIKLNFKKNQLNLHAAFYKNPEYIDPTRLGRYSFDIVSEGDQTNQEINQFNLRAAYDLLPSDGMVLNLGVSFEGGLIYNQAIRKKGDRYAVAVHADFKYRDWNIQLQGIDYKFNPNNPTGVSDETIQFGAFMFPFLVATDAQVITFNVAKTINVGWQAIDAITFYNDFSTTIPSGSNVHNSIQNVTGFLIVKKGLYMYTDWISGQNMWFAGGPGIGLNEAGADDWNGRININFGYYFSTNKCR
jgi:hypothetical protein